MEEGNQRSKKKLCPNEFLNTALGLGNVFTAVSVVLG